jgi:hypothetical protein
MSCETEMIKHTLVTAALVISSVGAFAQAPATTTTTPATPAAPSTVKAAEVKHDKAAHVVKQHKEEVKTVAATPAAAPVVAPVAKPAEVKPSASATPATPAAPAKDAKKPEAAKQ